MKRLWPRLVGTEQQEGLRRGSSEEASGGRGAEDSAPVQNIPGTSLGVRWSAEEVAPHVRALEMSPLAGEPLGRREAGEAVRHLGTVLMVCTGNVCRSPYMELRLRQLLRGAPVTVVSAGVGGLDGAGIDEGSARLLRELGIDCSHFVARTLVSRDITAADLVLTATREHRRSVVQLNPAGLAKTFALLDFAEILGYLSDESGEWESVAELVAAASQARAHVPVRRDESDVVDPYRRDAATFGQMQRQLEPALGVLAQHLAP